MNTLALCFVVQLGPAFGLAGLFWPDKFMPLFEILMFPWAASCRAIRPTALLPLDCHYCFLSRGSLAIIDRDGEEGSTTTRNNRNRWRVRRL